MNIDLKPFGILGVTCVLSAMLTVLIGIIHFFIVSFTSIPACINV